jgi:phytoene dehydrogenase-like protein
MLKIKIYKICWMANQHQFELNGDIEINKEKIVVLGGGLAGLTTAILIARAGMSVTIIERSTEIGGQARTSVSDGFYLNQGPHAIYAAGPGVKILKELGITYTGQKVTTGGYYAFKKDKKYPIPGSLRQPLTTKLQRITK